MNNLEIFKNNEFGEIRTIKIEEEIYFVGKDVAIALGYSNTKDAISSHIEEEDKTIIQRSENTTLEIPNRGLTVINESGLYSLVLSSKLPTAKKFKRWVTSEVLPAIRKTGMYATSELLDNPDLLIEAATRLKEYRQQNLLLDQRVKELEPKADYYDKILQNKSLIPISHIAKNYGMSAQHMNNLLHELGVQYKCGDAWLIYAKHQDKGYTHTEPYMFVNSKTGKEDARPNTKWTQKGHIFIYQLLKKNGYMPLIEQ